MGRPPATATKRRRLPRGRPGCGAARGSSQAGQAAGSRGSPASLRPSGSSRRRRRRRAAPRGGGRRRRRRRAGACGRRARAPAGATARRRGRGGPGRSRRAGRRAPPAAGAAAGSAARRGGSRRRRAAGRPSRGRRGRAARAPRAGAPPPAAASRKPGEGAEVGDAARARGGPRTASGAAKIRKRRRAFFHEIGRGLAARRPRRHYGGAEAKFSRGGPAARGSAELDNPPTSIEWRRPSLAGRLIRRAPGHLSANRRRGETPCRGSRVSRST